jgi:hypothetical protein
MTGKPNRRSRTTKRMRTQRSRVGGDPGLAGALKEIERVLATPLVELMDSEEERAHARELTRQANVAPALARFRELLAFVGEGRRATQAGKLTPTDAIELASSLGGPGLARVEVRSIEDLPDVAHLFHWAVAADLLTVRGARILPGHWAEDLQRDPLSAWFKAATTLLEHGLLAGFRRGWRKQYVEFLDAGVPFLLSAILNAGGEAPVAAIEELVWERVAAAYGYQLDDAAERRHVDRLVQGIFAQLADLGAAERIDQGVRLTELGGALAAAASAVIDNDDELLE